MNVSLLSCAVVAICATTCDLHAADVVAHYSFDKDFTDGSGGLDLNAVGDARISKEAAFGGGALALDGDGDYAWVGDPSFNFSREDFSVAFWWRRNKGQDVFEPLVGLGDSVGNIGYAVRLVATPLKSKPGLIDGVLNDDTQMGAKADQPMEQTRVFQHVVFQRRDGNIELFLNGELVDSKSNLGDVDLSAKNGRIYAFAVGTRNTLQDGSGSIGSFDGLVDEVWVFNAGLSPEQVKALKEQNALPK